jgi:hypothetical protein
MPSIGHILREAREKKGVSIADVSHATRIKIEYLEKMEADQFDKLIAPAYAKSFLRMYSQYLGLDVHEMLSHLGTWEPKKSAPSAPAAPPAPRKPAMPSGARQPPARPAAPQPKPRTPEPPAPTTQTAPVTQPKPTAVEPPLKQSAPPAKPSSNPPLRLKEEPKKSPPPAPPQPVSIEQPHGFPLKATIAVAVVIVVALAALVLLYPAKKNKPADTDSLEIKAQETLRAKPHRAADVLPVPPAP